MRLYLFILGFVAVLAIAGCKPNSVHPEAGLWTADGLGGSGGTAPYTEDGCISLLNGLDPLWMLENGWDLPCPDMDDDGILNDCDIDLTLGADCDSNGIDDSCEIDSDGDFVIDACDTDDDDDGDSDEEEIACGSDPLDASSTCYDCEESGTSDANAQIWSSDFFEFGRLYNLGASDGQYCLTRYSGSQRLAQLVEDYNADVASHQDAIFGGDDSDETCYLLAYKTRILEWIESSYDRGYEDNNNFCRPVEVICQDLMLGQFDVSRKGYFAVDGVNYRIELKNFIWDNNGYFVPTRAMVKVDGAAAQTTEFSINWNMVGFLYLGDFDLSSGQGNVAIWEAVRDSFFCFNNDCLFRLDNGSTNPDLSGVRIDWRH